MKPKLEFHPILAAVVIGLLGTCLGGANTVADQAKVFRAGACVVDITPAEFPVSSAGSMTHRTAEGAHDPLRARCLVLDNGQAKIAIVVCDSCMIPRQIFDAAKEKVSRVIGIPTGHILCSATHTHTAVTATPTFQSKVEVEYCEMLTQRIAKGIIKADSQLEPARIGWAVGNNPRQVFNRRWFLRPGSLLADPFDRGTDKVRMNPGANDKSLVIPAGPTDPEIPVIAVQSLDGRPIALWANYSLHYVGGTTGGETSGDYFSVFADRIARLLGAADGNGPFVGMMSNGLKSRRTDEPLPE